MSDNTFTRHGPCEKCGSSDGVGWYDDGHGFCFVCEATYPASSATPDLSRSAVSDRMRPRRATTVTPPTTVFRELTKRNIPLDAVRKYRIDVNTNPEIDVAHRYPYFKNGEHVANKVRRRSTKDFYWEGRPDDAELFGQHLFPPGSARAVTVVEGELDAPSGWTLLGSRYPVVSVLSGGSAVKDCQRNFNYLNSFEEVVLCLDSDDVGQTKAKKIAELFTPGKCRILTLSEGKDANEYRVKKIDPKVFIKEWWQAPKFTPDGLILGHELWERLQNRPNHFQVPYPFEGLNLKTYGVRLSEFVVINAPSGVGKTSLLKEIEYGLLTNPEIKEKGYGVGFLHLEEQDTDLALGLLSIHNSKPYHLPDTPRTDEELKRAYDEILDTSRVVVYDHFGSNEIDAILSRVRHMAALGCKYIVLDHLSIVVSDQAGDERKQLDEISTKLKTFCMEQNVALISVIHQNRDGKIRGTAGVEQLANIVLRLERDIEEPDPWRRNVTKVWVTKNRFCGRTGPGCYLFYDDVTGRLRELNQEEIDSYESGLTSAETF